MYSVSWLHDKAARAATERATNIYPASCQPDYPQAHESRQAPPAAPTPLEEQLRAVTKAGPVHDMRWWSHFNRQDTSAGLLLLVLEPPQPLMDDLVRLRVEDLAGRTRTLHLSLGWLRRQADEPLRRIIGSRPLTARGLLGDDDVLCIYDYHGDASLIAEKFWIDLAR